MQWTKVESSQIAEVGFEEPDTLGMRFLKKDGSVSEYTYAGVPFRMYRAMLTAKSVGIYFKDNIKDKKDEAGDLLYPYTKVESELPGIKGAIADFMGTHGVKEIRAGGTTVKLAADPTPASTPVLTVDAETPVSTQSNGAESTTVEGAVNLDTALAIVDGLKPDFVFVPGNMDKYLVLHRTLALAEVAGLNPSTKKMRDAIKKTKAKVVHSRTFIEKMRVGYVSAEKQRLKRVDEESTRIQDIYHGIEDEVLAVTGYTAWETKEKTRVDAHDAALKAIREMLPHTFPDIPSLKAGIEKLKAIDTASFEEFAVPAYHAQEEALDALIPELERRETAERERAELEALRAEQAATKERERLAEAQRQEDARVAAAAEKLAADRVQAAVEAARVETRQEVVAELTTKPPMVHVSEVSTYPTIEDLPISTDTVPDDTFFVHVSVPTKSHAEKIEGEAIKAIMENGFPAHVAAYLVAVIAKGLIPHVTITY